MCSIISVVWKGIQPVLSSRLERSFPITVYMLANAITEFALTGRLWCNSSGHWTGWSYSSFPTLLILCVNSCASVRVCKGSKGRLIAIAPLLVKEFLAASLVYSLIAVVQKCALEVRCANFTETWEKAKLSSERRIQLRFMGIVMWEKLMLLIVLLVVLVWLSQSGCKGFGEMLQDFALVLCRDWQAKCSPINSKQTHNFVTLSHQMWRTAGLFSPRTAA